MSKHYDSVSVREANPFHAVSTSSSPSEGAYVPFDGDRNVFANEDPRVIPLCDIDIEAINRVENEMWFGRR